MTMPPIGQPTMQGPQFLTPQVIVDPQRVVVRTWDWVTVAPGQLPLIIPHGAAFKLRVEWQDGDGKPRNLSGWTPSMAIRQQAGDEDPLLTITPAISVPFILIDVPAATTGGYDGWTRALYELRMTKAAEVVRLLQGTVELWKA